MRRGGRIWGGILIYDFLRRRRRIFCGGGGIALKLEFRRSRQARFIIHRAERSIAMQIEITGHHLEITDALRAHVERRLSRIDGRRRVLQNVHVVLNVDHKRHLCDLMTRLEGGEFVARGEDDDMYAAIDRAAEKMERQLHDAKERKTAHRGR